IKDATVAHLPALVDTAVARTNTSLLYSTGSSIGTTADFGDTVTVTVDYTFPLLDPLIQSFIPQVHVRAVAARDITTGCASTQAVIPTIEPTNTSVSSPTGTATSTPPDTATATSTATATATSAATATPC